MADNKPCWTDYVSEETTQKDYLLVTLEYVWQAEDAIVELEPTPTICKAVEYLQKAIDVLEYE